MKLSGLDAMEAGRQTSLAPKRRRVHAGTRLYVGSPAEIQSAPLLNCVREIVKHNISVSAAYDFNLAIGECIPSYSIGILFDNQPTSHEVNSLFSKIGYFMRPFLGDAGFVDLLSLYPTSVLAVTVCDQITPFYRRRIQ